MTKTYKTEAAAKTAATKAAKKLAAQQAQQQVAVIPAALVVDELVDAWPLQAFALPPGWQVIEAGDAEPEALLNTTLKAVRSPKTVTLTLPLTTVSSTYLGALHDGREIWFDKKSLEAFEVETEAKMLTVTMARSKAVRRRLVQPAA